MAPPNYYIPQTGSRGLWPQTATIDWCEQNYELSYFVAEFWNTLSNLAFILPQLIQYFALKKHANIEPAFRNLFLSLAFVGVGSFLFHMTLVKPMQMFDETSMILVSLHGFYLLYIIKNPSVDRKILMTLLVCYGLTFLCLYVFLVDRPVFHHTCFGLLVYASIYIGYKLKQEQGPYYKFWTVLILQHTAFFFWLIDKHYCEVLTQFRENHVPSSLRPIFQFHAVWHLLMGLGSHIYACGLIRLRSWTKYREEFAIRFEYLGLWIYLEKLNAAASPLASLERQKKLAQAYQNNLKLRKNARVLDTNDNVLDLNQNQTTGCD